jgi:hypothetical protein
VIDSIWESGDIKWLCVYVCVSTAALQSVLYTCRENRRWATLRPPRRLEICGLSARIVLFLSTSSCVYSRFSSACGQVHQDNRPIYTQHALHICNYATIPWGLNDPGYHHSGTLPIILLHCILCLTPSATPTNAVTFSNTATVLHSPPCAGACYSYVGSWSGLDMIYNLTT